MNDPGPSARIHADLQRWLLANHGDADPLSIVSALSYEIAAIVALVNAASEPRMTRAEIRALLRSVLSVMERQIHAHDLGLPTTE